MFARTSRLTLRPAWPEDAPALARAIGHQVRCQRPQPVQRVLGLRLHRADRAGQQGGDARHRRCGPRLERTSPLTPLAAAPPDW